MSPRVEDWMDETIDIGTFRGFSVALQNACLSREQNRLTYLHELRHINDGDLYIADEADNIETKRHAQ